MGLLTKVKRDFSMIFLDLDKEYTKLWWLYGCYGIAKVFGVVARGLLCISTRYLVYFLCCCSVF